MKSLECICKKVGIKKRVLRRLGDTNIHQIQKLLSKGRFSKAFRLIDSIGLASMAKKASSSCTPSKNEMTTYAFCTLPTMAIASLLGRLKKWGSNAYQLYDKKAAKISLVKLSSRK